MSNSGRFALKAGVLTAPGLTRQISGIRIINSPPASLIGRPGKRLFPKKCLAAGSTYGQFLCVTLFLRPNPFASPSGRHQASASPFRCSLKNRRLNTFDPTWSRCATHPIGSSTWWLIFDFQTSPFPNQLPWFFSSSPNQAVPVRYPHVQRITLVPSRQISAGP